MSIKKYAIKVAFAAAATWFLAGSAQATLVGRDINGTGVASSSASAVFLYDASLNITWLRNANAAAGSSFDNGASTTDGRMTWTNANSWANSLTVGRYSGWRLPTTPVRDTTCSEVASSPGGPHSRGTGCTGSELGHLFSNELGLRATPNGNFQNLQASFYWSENFPAAPGLAWWFNLNDGFQDPIFYGAEFYALAVRSGDVLRVTQVPEPGTLLLAAAALVGMGVVRRRRVVEGAGA
jgi:hypothetical protein